MSMREKVVQKLSKSGCQNIISLMIIMQRYSTQINKHTTVPVSGTIIEHDRTYSTACTHVLKL
jgi:hypothetical protein